MPNYANATIIGHLGRDAEVKVTAQDRCVINFTLATSRKVKDVETTTWWRVAYWCKSDKVSQYLKKGTPVLVSGEPYQREYEKDGATRLSLEIDAKDIKLLGGKRESDAAEPAPQQPTRPAAPPAGGSVGDGEPPFLPMENW